MATMVAAWRGPGHGSFSIHSGMGSQGTPTCDSRRVDLAGRLPAVSIGSTRWLSSGQSGYGLIRKVFFRFLPVSLVRCACDA